MELDGKTQRLIAVGASVAANCQSCLQIHITRALNEGIDQQEIAAAVEIGMQVRQGAASSLDGLIARLSQAAHLAAGKSGQGCGCSS